MKNIILTIGFVIISYLSQAQKEQRFPVNQSVRLSTVLANGQEMKFPKFDIKLVTDSLLGNALDALESTYIDVVINNSGEAPGKNLKLMVDVNNDIEGLTIDYPTNEFTIATNDRIIKRINISGEINLQDQQEVLLMIKLIDPNKMAPQVPVISLKTASFKPPQLALTEYKFTVDNEDKKFNIMSSPILEARIENIGEGDAENIELNIQYQSSILPLDKEKYLKKIISIPAGGYKDIRIMFFIQNDFNQDSILVTLRASEKFAKYGFDTQVGVPMNGRSSGTNTLALRGNEKEQEVIYKTKLVSDVDINIPITSKKRPNALAVVIGNRNYTKTSNVDFAINDSRMIKEYLITSMGFDEGNIIYKEDADQSDFFRIFGKKDDFKGDLYYRSRDNIEEIFIYYAGHGAPNIKEDSKEKTGYFVPVNCDPNYVNLNGYSSDVFYNNIDKIGIEMVTVVLDACFSGTSGSGDYIIKNISAIGIKPKGITNIKNGVLMASSKASEVSSWYVEQSHGLFTYFFLKSIHNLESDSNGDGIITYKESIAYIGDNVSKKANVINKIDQTPVFKVGISSDKILFQKE